MDTEEMYRRGLVDGEQGDPHPFYYQHYYHYRRGYDRGRKRNHQPDPTGRSPLRRVLTVLVICAVVLVGAGTLLLRSRAQSRLALVTSSAPTAAPRLARAATATPVLATSTPLPTPTAPPPIIHVDGQATVTNKQGLNARLKPGLKSAIKAKFKAGEQVQVREGPVDAEGYTWWRIEGPSGMGWSAQQAKDGQVWLEAAQN